MLQKTLIFTAQELLCSVWKADNNRSSGMFNITARSGAHMRNDMFLEHLAPSHCFDLHLHYPNPNAAAP